MPYTIPQPMYVRSPDLRNVLGFSWSRTHIIPLCKEGKFPKPHRLSPNRVAWDVDELLEWKAAREVAGPQTDRRYKDAVTVTKRKPRVLLEDDTAEPPRVTRGQLVTV